MTSTAAAHTIEASYDSCMGSGLCSMIAAKNFEVVDGTVTILQAEVGPDTLADVEEAIDACPTQALRFRQQS